jgi:hypothetical protein
VIFGSTRVSVLRGDTGVPNGFGDLQDTDAPAVTGLPAWVAQGSLTRRDPADGQLLTLSGYWVEVRASTPFDFQPTDRIRDEKTGTVLQVETIRRATGFAGARQRIFCTMSA